MGLSGAVRHITDFSQRGLEFMPKIQIRLTLANVLRQDYLNQSSYFDALGSQRQTSRYPSSMNVRLNLEMTF